ncbi:MAG: O-antigen ligase domain-containing protein [Chloroflexi bacterium]|nr:O-antigen ligase domain-containing protein [Chloroflexota bacterium]
MHFPSRMPWISHWWERTPWQFLLGAALGLLAGFVVMAATLVDTKAGLALIGAVALILVAVRLRRAAMLAIFLAAFGIQTVLTKSVGSYVEYHMNGAAGFYISSIDLVVVGLYLLALFDRERLRLLASNLFNPAVLLFAGFIAVAVLSIMVGDQFKLGVVEVSRMVVLLALFYFFAFGLRDQQEVRAVIVALCLAIVIQGAWGLAQFVLKRTFGLNLFGELKAVYTEDSFSDVTVRRVSGSLRDGPTAYGAFLALIGAIPMALAFYESRPRWRLFYALLGLIAFVCSALGLGRGAIMQEAATMVLLTLVAIRRKRLKLRTVAIVLVVALLIAIVPAYLMREQLWARFFGWSGPVDIRVKLIQVAMKMLADHPIVGIGLNTFQEMAPFYDPQNLLDWVPDGTRSVFPVHNYFLLILSETGILGFGMFLWLTIHVLYRGWKATHGPNPWLSWLATGIFCALISFLMIEEQTSYMIRLLQTSMIYYLLMGLLISLERLNPPRLAAPPWVPQVVSAVTPDVLPARSRNP